MEEQHVAQLFAHRACDVITARRMETALGWEPIVKPVFISENMERIPCLLHRFAPTIEINPRADPQWMTAILHLKRPNGSNLYRIAIRMNLAARHWQQNGFGKWVRGVPDDFRRPIMIALLDVTHYPPEPERPCYPMTGSVEIRNGNSLHEELMFSDPPCSVGSFSEITIRYFYVCHVCGMVTMGTALTQEAPHRNPPLISIIAHEIPRNHFDSPRFHQKRWILHYGTPILHIGCLCHLYNYDGSDDVLPI